MLLKSKTNSGAPSPKSSSLPIIDVNDAKTAISMTDEATSRATAAAVAKAKEVVQNGGTQAEAAAAAREVALKVLKEIMQVSSLVGEVTSGSGGRDESATSMANHSHQVSSALDLESNLPAGNKIVERKGRYGGQSSSFPRNAGSKGRVGLLSKFRKKMKTSKDKKMKSVPEEKTIPKVENANDTDGVVVIHAIEENRDEVEVMPSTDAATLDETNFGRDNTAERDANLQNEILVAEEDDDDVLASKEDVVPQPQLLSKSSSETTQSDSSYFSTFDYLDSYDSERVHHPRASYYMEDWKEGDDKDSVTSDVNILDAMLNMDNFMDALDEALFPVGTKDEGVKKKIMPSKSSNHDDYEEDQRNCSVWQLITCRGGCCTQDSQYDSSVGYSDILASGESIQSDVVDSGTRSIDLNKPVAPASTHNVETSVTISSSASASLTKKEDNDVVKHGKSVSWADSMIGRRDNHAPDASITKSNAKPISPAKESVSGAATGSRVQNSSQMKTLSKLNAVSNISADQSKMAILTPNKVVEHATSSKGQNEEDSTVADDSITSKMKILFRTTMSNNPLWGAAKAANQCYFPTGGIDAANNPVISVVANTGNDDFPNWRDSVADTVQTTTRPVNGNIEQSQIHHIQQQYLTYPPGQGYFQQQQVSPYQSSGGFYPTSPSSCNPQGVGFQNNHVPLPMSPQRFGPVNSSYQGNYYQTSNRGGGQWQNQSQGAIYEVRHQHPNIASVLPRINSNLSVLSAEDKEDRYAGLEQPQRAERYDQTIVNPGPYHSPVMGSSSVGGYGNSNLVHFGQASQQGRQGAEAGGPVGGNIVYNIGDNDVGYSNVMVSQQYNGIDGLDMSSQSIGFNGLGPNMYAYHLHKKQQQLDLYHNQPRQQIEMENGQQNIQSPLAYQ